MEQNKKIFFLGAVGLIALSLSGCHYQRGYRAGKASAAYQVGWFDGRHEGESLGLQDKVKNLEMHNAALKAANEYLMDLDCEHGRK